MWATLFFVYINSINTCYAKIFRNRYKIVIPTQQQEFPESSIPRNKIALEEGQESENNSGEIGNQMDNDREYRNGNIPASR